MRSKLVVVLNNYIKISYNITYYLKTVEAVEAQRRKRVTVDATVVGTIPQYTVFL